jgi:CDP-2,3-bis-(O-geranylgeranyl)-sn-glycerol synthase
MTNGLSSLCRRQDRRSTHVVHTGMGGRERNDVEPLVREGIGIIYLLLPLFGGAIVHGVCWKYGWLSFLVCPLDYGLTFRGKRVFGQHKTWRGLVTVALGAAVILELQSHLSHWWPAVTAIELFDYGSVKGWALGALVGAAAEFAELPNSFVKRQCGIAPGGTTQGFWSIIFYVWDQIDLLAGAWLVFASVVSITLFRIGLSILFVLILHPSLTVIGYLFGMRETMR